ncbi:hypothetical protein F4813DRAFT_5234 [Daldinia decipiens]|uniref:uncharacterized protein n=1 Tax=Daldinia decipiens TaxID=326647 RepID=UPI0020C54D6B|nr:uncharacterized protein F4813DRAFT_5234 [Daldinia decipiens]XP_049161972.1 uncharacterized protein F4817DRAFT_313097 [Daldinia loculata]KAI1650238.1 hypothetical protein F4817DRAFT_313097 [Daldinia loculata]KAI1662643.1 hypothetical protein F4813DRAFT_5234 [Daldinia decipiens]KAI2781413.1 hypothetical protein F4815DRAFT_444195 [Daldinia loculata]
MPAINNAVVARDTLSHIVRRENWAQQEAGVIVVFCIVFVVAVGLIGLWISKAVAKRRATKAAIPA